MPKLIRTLSDREAVLIIARNHAAEVGKSPTLKREFFERLKNPNAGVDAHLETCPRCATDIEFTELLKAMSSLSPSPAIAMA